ncbi:MAG: NAD(P)/FAD-dependent oxidoreductase [Actinomycetota bacterium]
MSRVLILGGGFGGISTAHHLRSMLSDRDEIVLVDRTEHFMMGFRKTAMIVGQAEERRSLLSLKSRGIDVRLGSIASIDPSTCSATVDEEHIAADALVIALGADVVPGAISGLGTNGISYYSYEGAQRAHDAVEALQSGRIVIGIFGAPYKCPPAPFELALLLNDMLEERRRDWKISLFTPLPMSIPQLGKAGCNPLETSLFSKGIELRTNVKADSVEAGRVLFTETAGSMEFELLLAVAPHKVPAVCVEAGLAQQGGWVKANPRTLETPFPNVYALGDSIAVPLSNGTAIPKAGAIADEEGHVAASRIADRLAGREPAAEFDGRGACFLEVGGGQAMLVSGSFFEDPPVVELSAPSEEALAQKQEFESSRLNSWFGAG